MSSALELPFSSIKPLKFIGLDQSRPFCSIISQGKLIYSAGSNIIMENSKTNQQKILFTNSYSGEIELIHHHVTLYNEHLLAIALRDYVTLMHFIVVIPLNPIIFNEENKKDRVFTHYLKNIEQFQTIKQIFFYEEGNLFAVVTEYEQMNNLSIYRSSVGEPIHTQTFFKAQIVIDSTTVNKVNCLSLLDQRGKKQISLCLMTLDELTRRFYLGFNLNEDQEIIHHHFQSYQDENILVVLTNTGFILLLTFNEYEIKIVNRIDVKQPSKLSYHDQKDSVKKRKKISIKETIQCHPTNIQSSGNKIIISYQEDCLIGILFYSHYDFKITKFILVKDAFNNVPLAKSITDFKIAKDNCTLAVLLQISPEKISKVSEETQVSLNTTMTHQKIITPQIPFELEEFSGTRTHSLAQSYNSYNQLKESKIQFISQKLKREYIAVQVDILSNIIDHQEHACSTELTFSAYSAHFKVIKAQYCRKNNSLFLLTANKILKYYDLNPKQASSKFHGTFTHYKDFKKQGILLWQKSLLNQANHITIHPFNYTILLIYDQLLKFHYYNIKCLFPAFLINNIRNCTIAKYSPLGDKLIVATSGHIIALNSYTYEVIKTVSLPNIYAQSQLKRVSFSNPKKPVSNPKLITDLSFLKNGDILLFSGKNTFSMVLNYEKSSHFGFIEHQANEKYKQVIFDSANNLIILLRKQDILILSKASINSKNKCEVVSKIEIKATSAYLLTQLNVLFIGGEDGALFMINWPHYSQQDLYSQSRRKYFLFNEPIVSINISANLAYLYVVSKNGCFCICQLLVNEQRELQPHVKKTLLSASDIELRQNDRWLISRSQAQRKQREIVKLRGQQAQSANNYIIKLQKQQKQNAQLIESKKIQMQQFYLNQLRDYENKLGLQCTIQSAALLADQLKTIESIKARQIKNINFEKDQKIKQIFQTRTALEQEFKITQSSLQVKLQSFKQTLNRQFSSYIKQQDQNQGQKGQIKDKCLQLQSLNQLQIREKISHLQQQRFQEISLLKIQHQQIIQNLLQLNQSYLGKTRNMNIGIHQMQDKIGTLSVQKQKLEFDMYKVLDDRQKYQEMRNKVISQNEVVRKTYDKLMKQSKELEEKIQRQRKEHECFHHSIKVIQQEVNFLIDHEKSLQQRKVSLNTKFICEREENIRQDRQIASLQKKIQQLKLYKRQKSYELSQKRSHYDQLIRSILRNIQTSQQETVNYIIQQYKCSEQDQRIQSNINEEHQILKVKHQKMAKDSIRWNQVKQSYMNAFYRNNRKLEQQNLKLTYRYNDLLRLCQQYKSHATSLKQNIQKAKRSKLESRSLARFSDTKIQQARRPNFSFLIKSTSKKESKENRPYLKKKLICVSLHQGSGQFITQA